MNFVEDYLEYIGGLRAAKYPAPGKISLARYDVNIVNSMAQQTLDGISLTDRQAVLAHKIVVKYKRQLAGQGIDIGDMENNPQFRLPIRSIDRAKSVDIVENKLSIRFPYDTALVQYFQDEGRRIHGSLAFDHQSKIWKGAVTEPRLMWLQSLADKYQFELSNQVTDMICRVRNQAAESFGLKLVKTNSGFEITNSESSLTEYINDHLGGFGNENFINLIDYSGVLGYSVDNEIIEEFLGTHSTGIQKLLTSRESHFPISIEGNLEEILRYARLVQRKIYIYDDLMNHSLKTNLIEALKKEFGTAFLAVPNSQKTFDDSKYQCVYLSNWIPNWNLRVPLLLSLQGMIVGSKRQHIVQCAEKVVFCTDTVYNSIQ